MCKGDKNSYMQHGPYRYANQYDFVLFSTLIRVKYDNTISPLEIRYHHLKYDFSSLKKNTKKEIYKPIKTIKTAESHRYMYK